MPILGAYLEYEDISMHLTNPHVIVRIESPPQKKLVENPSMDGFISILNWN